jgi:hypothetical protein
MVSRTDREHENIAHGMYTSEPPQLFSASSVCPVSIPFVQYGTRNMYAPTIIVHRSNLGTVIRLVNYLMEMCDTQAPMVREPHDRL